MDFSKPGAPRATLAVGKGGLVFAGAGLQGFLCGIYRKTQSAIGQQEQAQDKDEPQAFRDVRM